MNINEYLEQNKERHLNEVFELLRFPSISTDPEYLPQINKCAEWVGENMKMSGLNNVKLFPTGGSPIVYADWLNAGEDALTILIYGHYDVQPPDPLELWENPPFEPVIKNGKIVARGSADDKCQFFLHVKAVETLLKTNGKLNINVKFIIEGEEESGSNHLEDFVLQNKELLKCNYVMVSDTEWFASGYPSICYGLRGLTYIELKVKGPNRDLHSGTFGGAVDNPITVLANMIAKLKDNYGRITIPNFYDDVVPLSKEEREGYKKLPFSEEEFFKDLSVEGGNGEYGYTSLERTWARPALDINGIYGGYTGVGAKTVLPSEATAKISIRLVPNQKSNDIEQKLENYLKAIAPPTVKLEIINMHGGEPVLVPREGKAVQSALTALKKAFPNANEPVFMREGGSIPIVVMFEQVLNAPTLLLGFGLPTDNIHSPNENFELEHFYKGILTSAIFLEEMAK